MLVPTLVPCSFKCSCTKLSSARCTCDKCLQLDRLIVLITKRVVHKWEAKLQRWQSTACQTAARGVQDALKDELAEVQQQLAFEKEEKASATAQVDALRQDVARIGSELEAFKASGVAGEGDLNDLKQALEDKAAQLNAQTAKVEELESQARGRPARACARQLD
jgi:chromosome segregation ATPase